MSFLTKLVIILVTSIFYVSADSINSNSEKDDKSYRIIDGKPASKEKWSFMAAVVDGTHFIGGGVLIKPDWVLTSSSLLLKRRYYEKEEFDNNLGVALAVDEIELTKSPIELNQVNVLIPIIRNTIPSEKYFIHPEHLEVNEDITDKIFTHDIALIKLKRSVGLTKYITLAILSTVPIEENMVCYTAGWGLAQEIKFPEYKHEFHKKNVLHEITFKIINQGKCQNSLSESLGGEKIKFIAHSYSTNKICHSSTDNVPYIYDIGGPLLCNGKVYGITSYTYVAVNNYNRNSLYFVLFSEVSKYMFWIEKQLRDGSEGVPQGNENVEVSDRSEYDTGDIQRDDDVEDLDQKNEDKGYSETKYFGMRGRSIANFLHMYNSLYCFVFLILLCIKYTGFLL